MARQISPRQLADELKAGNPVLLIDVRQPEEHALCKLAGSVLIPVGELAARLAEIQPEPGQLVVTYCHHGIRSLGAAGFLEEHGIAPVASLAGGVERWAREIDPNLPRY